VSASQRIVDGVPPPRSARAGVPSGQVGSGAVVPRPGYAAAVQNDPVRSQAALVFRADLPWPDPVTSPEDWTSYKYPANRTNPIPPAIKTAQPRIEPIAMTR